MIDRFEHMRYFSFPHQSNWDSPIYTKLVQKEQYMRIMLLYCSSTLTIAFKTLKKSMWTY
jgi:hypothetical protein